MDYRGAHSTVAQAAWQLLSQGMFSIGSLLFGKVLHFALSDLYLISAECGSKGAHLPRLIGKAA